MARSAGRAAQCHPSAAQWHSPARRDVARAGSCPVRCPCSAAPDASPAPCPGSAAEAGVREDPPEPAGRGGEQGRQRVVHVASAAPPQPAEAGPAAGVAAAAGETRSALTLLASAASSAPPCRRAPGAHAAVGGSGVGRRQLQE
eukprot:TRINITY_DN25309_c0_g3_i1.p2 TRINITY_DN25309_c0_g3~~TRINITY_DN25309_c0_g3_i1.p2  ORF type:complete len:144 (+),score=10.71 TRINITY_DN25309_c0_g3_i1:172-603(+)